MNIFNEKTGKVNKQCFYLDEAKEVIKQIENENPQYQGKVFLSKFDKIEAKLYALLTGILQYESIESKTIPLNI
jgi:hypothetical protein